MRALKKKLFYFVASAVSAFSAFPLAVYAVTTKALNDPNTFGGEGIKPTGINSNITDLPSLAGFIINFFLGFLGIIAVILVLISGFQWMTADSEDKVKEARKRLVNSVIGLAIIALAWVIGWAVIQSIAKITTT